MPTLRTHLTDPEAISRRLEPRDDALIREVQTGPGTFVAAEGPWATWERHVQTDDSGATETVTYHMDVPHWGWLIDLVLRRGARSGVRAGAKPWWSPTDRLTRRDTTVLGLCATLAVVAGFLGGLIVQTVAYITDDLGGNLGTQSNVLSLVRIGAVFTFAVTALADRRGRRPMLRACLVGSAIAALLTAVAPNMAAVTVTQVAGRGLAAGAAFLIPILCVEELPARSRAYAVGVMVLPGGLGAGMVLWFLPLLDLGPWAWRLIYAFAIVALVVTLRTVARLPESRRFEREERLPDEKAHQHMRGGRLGVLLLGLFLLNVFTAPTGQLQTDYLKNTRHMGPIAVAAFLLLTNTWGALGVVGGAQLADRRSRRLAAAIGLIGLTAGNTLMFQFGGVAMWMASILGSAVGAATAPSIGALMPELFPTLRRGAANGLLNGAGVVGSVVGLQIVGHVVTGGDYGPTIALLALGPLIVAGLVWLLPESAGIELEVLNPDD